LGGGGMGCGMDTRYVTALDMPRSEKSNE